MAAPYNVTFTQGSITPVSADSLNSLLQTVATVATLRTFTGVPGMTIWLQGTSTFNDGGQSLYGWSASSTAADNGGSVIAPTGSTVGRWLAQVSSAGSGAFSSLSVSGAITLAATTSIASDGTTITVTGKFATTDTATLADIAVTASHAASNVLAVATGGAGAPTWRQLAAADISGLGNMAQQSAASVAITGGVIDGTAIGGTMPAAGAFSTVAATTTVTAGVNGTAGTLKVFPGTSNRGSLNITQTANAGNTNNALVVAAQAAARTFTVPDPGALSTQFMLSSATPGATGLFGVATIRLQSCRNVDGSAMAAAATSGKFGISITPGTSMFLVTEAANASTATDNLSFELVLPATYVAATNISLIVNANYVLGSGVIGTHTLAMNAYLCATGGTMGATIIATAAQSVPTSPTELLFVITGATLAPGSRLLFTGQMIIQDTGASNIFGHINSIRLQ